MFYHLLMGILHSNGHSNRQHWNDILPDSSVCISPEVISRPMQCVAIEQTNNTLFITCTEIFYA